MKETYSFKIDNVLNIFTSDTLNNLIKNYHLDKYYYLDQIHSDKILIVDNNYHNNTSGDALVTTSKNTPIIIKTADCIPILIYDNKQKILGLIHSGWRGTLKNITKKCLDLFLETYHSHKEDISIYIYPSIRECHFEVGIDVYLEFKNIYHNIDDFTIKKQHKYYIDLVGLLKDILLNLGINNIYDSKICTYCNHDKYHSYRYNHTNERNYLLAYIKE